MVYKGFRTNHGDIVAIKEIPLKKPHAVQDIQNEINLLSMLKHERIVKYIDHYSSPQSFYIVMEFLENGSLAALVKKYKVTEDVVSSYIKQVLEGLVYLHKQGFIHRDIKGDNVLLTRGGAVKLADFGVSASLSLLKKDDFVGTPHWIAPEVISQSGVSEKSDIWSVGCLTIELLTGFPPYYKDNVYRAMFRIVNEDHPPIPSCSSAAEDFLMLCFKKEPKFRPSALTLLFHPWITKQQQGSEEISIPSFLNNNEEGHDEAVDTFNSWNSIPREGLKKEDTKKNNGKINLDNYKEDDDDDLSFDIPSNSGSSDGIEIRSTLIKPEQNASSQTLDSWDELDFKVDKISEVQTIIDDYISKIEPLQTSEDICKTCEDFIKFKSMSNESDYVTALNRNLSKRSLISVFQILENEEHLEEESVILKLLEFINILLLDMEPQYKEQLCLIGAFPKVTKFSAPQHSAILRMESIKFLYNMCLDNKSNLRMFIASEGVKTLVKFLSVSIQSGKNALNARNLPPLDYYSSMDAPQNITFKTLFLTIDLIDMVLRLQSSQTDKNDFCRLFSMHEFLIRTSGIFKSLLEEFREIESISGVESPTAVSPTFETVVVRPGSGLLQQPNSTLNTTLSSDDCWGSSSDEEGEAFSTVKVLKKSSITNITPSMNTPPLRSPPVNSDTSDDDESDDEDGWNSSDSSDSSDGGMKFNTVIYGGETSDEEDETVATTVFLRKPVNPTAEELGIPKKNREILRSYIDKIISIFMVFSNGDINIHLSFANKNVIVALVESFSYLSDSQKSQVITCLRHLAFDTHTHDMLTASGILSALVNEFSLVVYRPDAKVLESVSSKIYNQVVNCLYSLCAFNDKRLEVIASHGCVKLLSYAVIHQLPLKEMTLRLLFGVAVRSCSEEAKMKLLNEKGLDAYYFVLHQDKVWAADVFSALNSLLNNESIKSEIEKSITSQIDIFVQLFGKQDYAIDSVLPGFVIMLRLSENITNVFRTNLDLIKNICQCLSNIINIHSQETDPSPLIRNILSALNTLIIGNSHLLPNIFGAAQQTLSELVQYAQQKKLDVIREQALPLLHYVNNSKGSQ